VLNLRPQAGLEVLPALGVLALALVLQRSQLRGLLRDPECSLHALQLLALVRAGVAAVAADRIFLAVQQLVHLRHVIHVRRRALHVVHQARFLVHANVRLHPEVPLVALLRLVHLRVALAVPVLGRARCRNDRRIDDRAGLQALALTRQVRVHALQDLRRELVRLQQPAEVEDRGLVRDVVQPAQAGKAAHHRHLVQRLFHARVAQRVPLLQEVDAQHRRQGIRLPAALAHLRVVRCDQRQQCVPRHHLLHLRQEDLAPRLLALARVFRVPEAQLHRRHPSNLALLSPKGFVQSILR